MVTLQCDERDVGPTRGCVGWTSKRNDQSVREPCEEECYLIPDAILF